MRIMIATPIRLDDTGPFENRQFVMNRCVCAMSKTPGSALRVVMRRPSRVAWTLVVTAWLNVTKRNPLSGIDIPANVHPVPVHEKSSLNCSGLDETKVIKLNER